MIKIYTGYKILIQLYMNQVNYRCINYLFTDVQINFIEYELNYSSTIILINLLKQKLAGSNI